MMSGIYFKRVLAKKVKKEGKNERNVTKYWEVESGNRYMGLLLFSLF